jgi:hypothetical protein
MTRRKTKKKKPHRDIGLNTYHLLRAIIVWGTIAFFLWLINR